MIHTLDNYILINIMYEIGHFLDKCI